MKLYNHIKVWIALGFIAILALGLSACLQKNLLSRDPVAVYLTWQRAPDTTMTVQWIAPPKSYSAHLQYRQENSNIWLEATGFDRPLPQGHHDQYMHAVELTNLQPDAVYRFRFPHDSQEYRFRTMPSHLDDTVRFVVGGDMFHEGVDILQAANLKAAKTNPRFGVAGGDLAYASEATLGEPDNYERWIEFLVRWSEDMVTTDGIMIPMLPVLGNHDVNGRYAKPENAEFFYTLFAMPGPQGYSVLDFGDYMTFVMLDSEHTHPVGGAQADWLKSTLEQRQEFPHRFAAYHVPAYPSVRNFNGKHNPAIREHWVPLFEKYGLDIAFEHHEHAYKRTHPIKKGKVDPDGIVYMGDGAWGTTPRTPRNPEEAWYLANTKSAQHFIVVDISKDSRLITAIDVPTGKTFDKLLQKVSKIPAVH